MTQPAPRHPYSPYATADTGSWHLLMQDERPTPGSLAITACLEFAVVPFGGVMQEITADHVQDGAVHPGVCPTCLANANNPNRLRVPPVRSTCRECQGPSITGPWCGRCRIRLHELWWSAQTVRESVAQRPARPPVMWERIVGVIGECKACLKAGRSWPSGARIGLVTIRPGREGGPVANVCPV